MRVGFNCRCCYPVLTIIFFIHSQGKGVVQQRQRSSFLALSFGILSLLLVSNNAFPGEPKKVKENPIDQFTALYDELLKTYWHPCVEIHGIKTTVFDYRAMTDDSTKSGSVFSHILETLSSIDTGKLDVSDKNKAFWINAYNFAAIYLVVKHYPVESITDFKISFIKHPWSKRSLQIGSEYFSLAQIEKDILLAEYDDPRVLFAVGCAAISCPDRLPFAFRAENLDQHLDDVLRAFMKAPKKGFAADVENNSISLSWIFKKDAHLFENSGGVLAFLSPYFDPKIKQWIKKHDPKVQYFDHDWALNDLALGF